MIACTGSRGEHYKALRKYNTIQHRITVLLICLIFGALLTSNARIPVDSDAQESTEIGFYGYERAMTLVVENNCTENKQNFGTNSA